MFSRCLIETSEANQDSKDLLSDQAIEDIAFGLKCEDKPKLQ